MNDMLIISALALAAAALIVVSRLHVDRNFEDLILEIRLVGESTRKSLDRLTKTPQPGENLKNVADLLIFLWNSRLFVEMGNKLVVLVPENGEIKSITDDIVARHKSLRKLAVLSFGEKLMSVLLAMPAALYQNQAMLCYAESEDLIYCLVSFWRPSRDESALGEKI
jgi:hypothetical protein